MFQQSFIELPYCFHSVVIGSSLPDTGYWLDIGNRRRWSCVQAGWVSLVHRRHDMTNIICIMFSVDMEAIELGCRLNVLVFDS